MIELKPITVTCEKKINSPNQLYLSNERFGR